MTQLPRTQPDASTATESGTVCDAVHAHPDGDVRCQLRTGHGGNHWYNGWSPKPGWARTIATWPPDA